MNGRWGWGSTFSRKYTQTCSPGLRELVVPLTMPYTVIRASPRPPAQPKCGPQHIPQILPADWVEDLLGELSLTPGERNYLAVCRLVQTMLGGSLGGAAHFLGLPTNMAQGYRIANRGGLVLRAADEKGLDWLDKTLLEIPDRLREAGLIDYQRRRAVLEDWLIPRPIWNDMTERVLNQPVKVSTPVRQLFTSETERIIDSVVVWTLVTQGRKTLAPQMNKHRALLTQRSNHPTWRTFIGAADTLAGRLLLDLLRAYSKDVAHQIDDRHPGPVTGIAPR